jgi:outer membrane receptor for ferrienterochelin and colicin
LTGRTLSVLGRMNFIDEACWLWRLLRRAAWLPIALTSIVVCGVQADTRAQVQNATINGTALGPEGRPVDGTVITLLDPLGVALAHITAAADGRFQLSNVAPGTYSLRADAPPLRATVHALTVSGALPIEMDLRMSATASEQVTVRAERLLEPGSTTSGITLAGEAVRRAPARLSSRGLQDAIATAPGWATEDNGVLHVRGVDDGFLYVIDGVPVYERLDGLFGMAPDPALIDSVNVSTGYIPPEFGLKSGGVIEVRTGGLSPEQWLGSIDATVGSDATRHVSGVMGGPVARTMALTLGIAGQDSSRFLDPVHPDNLHNDGHSSSGGGQFGWSVSDATTVTTVAGFGRSHFDVPHGDEQEEAAQDQRQRIRQQWATLSAQHAGSSTTVSQVAAYHRGGSAALVGSSRDTPLFTDADRTLGRTGALASLTHHRGRHLLKVGGEVARLHLREHFTFAVTDAEEAAEAELSEEAIAHTPESPFLFDDTATATLVSFYVQDSFRPLDRLTLDVGVRADWSRMPVRASQWSPRIGAAYSWATTNTTLRASFGRFFQPPQAENLLLASSTEARALSPFAVDGQSGGGELQPERQTAAEIGIEQLFWRGTRLDVAYWRRRVKHAADPNVFFGTTIVFPNTVARGRASGLDVRLEVPRRGGWSGYVSYANAMVEQEGPITGGLFLEDDIADIGPGTRFTPDHDQRNVGAIGLTYDHEGGFSASLSARYESGTPIEVDREEQDELRERPGAELVDFERGRVKPRRVIDAIAAYRVLRLPRADVNVRVSLLNLTGARWAYNFGNPFSGTHFGPGRTLQAGVRLAFR